MGPVPNGVTSKIRPLTRRTALRVGAGAATLVLAGAVAVSKFTQATDTGNTTPASAKAPEWLTLLGRSDSGGRDSAPRIEGTLPAGLEGALYRNGPGLFERAGVRKRNLLDGDGLVQCLTIRDGRARYRNVFVGTAKYRQEDVAGHWLYATASQREPGGVFANLGGGTFASQAGVTVYPQGGALYAFDEVSPPYALDPMTLETRGAAPLGRTDIHFAIKAHAKRDPMNGDWLLTAVTNGRALKLHAIVHGADGTLKSHVVVDSPRNVYIHDFFATERHYVFLLHPLHFRAWRFLAGLDNFIECLEWRGGDGNRILVMPRAGGAMRSYEAPAAFMWHALNAYERPGEIVADFVGYDAPDHFIGHDARLRALMRGELGVAREKGKLRRYIIDLTREGRLREEIVDAGSHEFPMTDPRVATRRHRVGYLSAGGVGPFTSGVKRVDLETGRQQLFDFGSTTVAGEPVFAARPGGAVDQGWLLVQCLDGASGKAFFAVFDAEQVGAGPLAKLWLDHPLPISFHGCWVAA